jgi:hypothetical protein
VFELERTSVLSQINYWYDFKRRFPESTTLNILLGRKVKLFGIYDQFKKAVYGVGNLHRVMTGSKNTQKIKAECKTIF